MKCQAHEVFFLRNTIKNGDFTATKRGMNMNLQKETYKKLADAHAPRSPLGKDCFRAFWVGGTICVLAQLLRDLYENVFKFQQESAATLTSVTLIF